MVDGHLGKLAHSLGRLARERPVRSLFVTVLRHVAVVQRHLCVLANHFAAVFMGLACLRWLQRHPGILAHVQQRRVFSAGRLASRRGSRFYLLLFGCLWPGRLCLLRLLSSGPLLSRLLECFPLPLRRLRCLLLLRVVRNVDLRVRWQRVVPVRLEGRLRSITKRVILIAIVLESFIHDLRLPRLLREAESGQVFLALQVRDYFVQVGQNVGFFLRFLFLVKLSSLRHFNRVVGTCLRFPDQGRNLCHLLLLLLLCA